MIYTKNLKFIIGRNNKITIWETPMTMVDIVAFFKKEKLAVIDNTIINAVDISYVFDYEEFKNYIVESKIKNFKIKDIEMSSENGFSYDELIKIDRKLEIIGRRKLKELGKSNEEILQIENKKLWLK